MAALERLTVEEILDEHRTCVKWSRAGNFLRAPQHSWSEELKGKRRAIKALLWDHQDVIEAAVKCCAGRGHH